MKKLVPYSVYLPIEHYEKIKVLAIEAPFVLPMVNPDTGAASRTFSVGGFVDAIVEVE